MVKEKTKGQKLILEENASTLFFYRTMSLAATGVYLVCCWLLFNNYSSKDQFMVILCLAILFACNKFLSSMARTKVSETGAVLDEGCDLNMEGGIAEHVKDVIILTAASLCLSTISSYFWLLLLFAPLRVGQMLWTNFISPWIFSGSDVSPEETEELDERALKKQKKLEKRQRRGW